MKFPANQTTAHARQRNWPAEFAPRGGQRDEDDERTNHQRIDDCEAADHTKGKMNGIRRSEL